MNLGVALQLEKDLANLVCSSAAAADLEAADHWLWADWKYDSAVVDVVAGDDAFAGACWNSGGHDSVLWMG